MSEAWGARLMYDVRPYYSYRLLNHERKVKAPGYRVTAIVPLSMKTKLDYHDYK
jgi:hypothetical protein